MTFSTHTHVKRTRKPSEEQLLWLHHWGQDGYLWYPADWQQIEDVFSGRI